MFEPRLWASNSKSQIWRQVPTGKWWQSGGRAGQGKQHSKGQDQWHSHTDLPAPCLYRVPPPPCPTRTALARTGVDPGTVAGLHAVVVHGGAAAGEAGAGPCPHCTPAHGILHPGSCWPPPPAARVWTILRLLDRRQEHGQSRARVHALTEGPA